MRCHDCPVSGAAQCWSVNHPHFCTLQREDPAYHDQLLRLSGVPVAEPEPTPVAPTLTRFNRPYRDDGSGRLVVVARYQEDLDWLNDCPYPTHVYNKGATIALPDHVGVTHMENRGREASAYLRFICDHYSSLPSWAFFLQGQPHSGSELFGRLVVPYQDTTSLTREYSPTFPSQAIKDLDKVEWHGDYEVRYGLAQGSKRNPNWLRAVWERWFSCEMPQSIYMPYGAEFAVPRHRILARPLEFWIYALEEVIKANATQHDWDLTPDSAHAFEAIWMYLFGDAERYPVRMPGVKLPEVKVEVPGFWKKAQNFAKAAVTQVSAGFPMASDDERLRRRSICDRCPHNRNGVCGHCGCGLNNVSLINKQAWGTSVCPIGKWAFPRIIHQTWKDSNPPAEVYDPKWISSWTEHHPGWQYRLWTDEDLELLVRKEVPEHLQWFRSVSGVIRADFGRYLVLWSQGGLYADLDYECLRPFDEFLDDGLFLSWEDKNKSFINTALMGGSARQPIFKKAYQEAASRYRPDLPHDQIHHATGPGMFTEVCRASSMDLSEVKGSTLFSPLDWRRDEALSLGMDRSSIEKRQQQAVDCCAYAITYWTGNWGL